METTIIPQLQKTQQAAAAVRRLSDEQKKALLIRLAEIIAENKANIITENEKDLL